MSFIKVYYIDIEKHNIDKKQGSELLKRKVLGDRKICRSENGKPYCDDVFFNISHSGKYVVLATADSEIGIDIEKIRDTEKRLFAEDFASKEEFFEMWTKKESIIKYLGKTIISMKNINVEDYGKLLKTSDFFEGYAFSICTKDYSKTEFEEIMA